MSTQEKSTSLHIIWRRRWQQRRRQKAFRNNIRRQSATSNNIIKIFSVFWKEALRRCSTRILVRARLIALYFKECHWAIERERIMIEWQTKMTIILTTSAFASLSRCYSVINRWNFFLLSTAASFFPRQDCAK